MKCKICKKETKSKYVITRSGKKKIIYYCNNCDYEFFDYDPVKNLKRNQLNISRLKKAGLNVPKINVEFNNGIEQSKKYLEQYIKKSDKKKYILDVGCSLGYFLYTCKKFGCEKVYGLEVNETNRKFVKKKLKIRCEKNIDIYEKEIIKFDKIFLFYSLEYVSDPLDFIRKLYLSLNQNGEIIIITPNKSDVIKNLLVEKNYLNFFYDINSINYFSLKSFKVILKKLNLINFKIYNKQGYSLLNLFNWFLNKKPISSAWVGEDSIFKNFVDEIIKNKKNYKDNLFSKNLYNFFIKTNNNYKKSLEKNRLGNQIILKIHKR